MLDRNFTNEETKDSIGSSVAGPNRKPVIEQGSLQTVLQTLVTKDMLGIIRRHGASVVALIINFSDTSVTADASTWMNIPEQLIVYASSVHSKLLAGSRIDTTRITIPGSASVGLTSANLAYNYEFLLI
ncbi:hypothetical protein EAG_14479 [Camponotus floridanus]|uniref:Uncharacterized protein n=1 Tax=Camponotus floridanus TaxID=104421 RepID=E2APT5_CAMFO|nr:hypothetical protein EAG_14479 [Camponotus floridanus]